MSGGKLDLCAAATAKKGRKSTAVPICQHAYSRVEATLCPLQDAMVPMPFKHLPQVLRYPCVSCRYCSMQLHGPSTLGRPCSNMHGAAAGLTLIVCPCAITEKLQQSFMCSKLAGHLQQNGRQGKVIYSRMFVCCKPCW